MTSPARSHYEAKMAEKSAIVSTARKAGKVARAEKEKTDAGALLLAALGNDLKSLSEIRSIKRKIEAKRGMIDRYRDWIEGHLKAGEDGKASPDDIVGTILVWSIDLGDWDYALKIAAHLINHKLPLPERYPRNAATLLADEIGDSFLKRDMDVPREVLQQAVSLIAGEDVVDQAAAKLHRALGDSFVAEYDTFNPDAESARAGELPALVDAALVSLKRARKLNPKVGVVKTIERMESAQKKIAAPDRDQT